MVDNFSTFTFFRQKEFFDSTSLKTVEDFIGGQNALIFTYGVTSSGMICCQFKAETIFLKFWHYITYCINGLMQKTLHRCGFR